MVTTAIKNQKKVSVKEAQVKMSEKSYRAEKAAKVWDNNPLFKGEFSKIKESADRQRMAINVTNQARYLRKLSEEQVATEFHNMAPANMMRLVTLTANNSNRGNVFTEFAMETARDAIYYIKPTFSKPFSGNDDFSARTSDRKTPFGHGLNDEALANNYTGEARKVLYESTEDRYSNELAEGKNDGSGVITFESEDGKPFDKGFINGYCQVYYGLEKDRVPVAFQDKDNGKFFINPDFEGLTIVLDANTGKLTVTGTCDYPEFELGKVNAFARYASETDYEGTHLGEVDLAVSVFELHPQRTSIGVSWTKLSEIVLDASYNSQVDTMLLSYATDFIKAQTDYRAFRDSYNLARTNPKDFLVTFDAAYSTVSSENPGTKDGYLDNAQTFSSAIETASNVLYENIKRGAINKMVCGPDAATYLKLMAGFSPKGLQDPVGVYKFGELDGIDLYKAPSDVIPSDEILCVFKNAKVENDVAIVYGTLVPFVSTKLEYPNFYTRAGLASYGDYAVLNKKYLTRIKIANLKDTLKKRSIAG